MSRGSAGRRRTAETAREDPLGLDGALFRYQAHRMQHGEAFVAYRVLGSPVVLTSLVDGLPLASLHLRVVPRRAANGEGEQADAQALIARRPDRGASEFLGVVSADGQEVELVMTNLTGKDVLMFDIGGCARAQEPEFWEHTDASFWSGRHRNDRRLNRSNILWPLTPNVCSENNLHLLDHGEHRRLVLRAWAEASAEDGAGASASDFEGGGVEGPMGFPLWVYPKHGTRTARRFARTAWSCPETIMVVGTPTLLGADLREEYNIQVARPPASSSAAGADDESAADELGQASLALGVARARLAEVLGIDDAFFRGLPSFMRREAVASAFARADLSALEDEPPPEVSAPLKRTRSQSSSGAQDGQPAPHGTRPADVAVGRRLLSGNMGHSLLIEKFDFELAGASATLSLGVRDGVQVLRQASAALADDAGDSDDAPSGPTSQNEEAQLLSKRLDQLVATRSAELMEDSRSTGVYSTPECVVCMEGDPPPDTVFYQCGHRCVHLRCVDASRLRRCPLCRAPVVALLPSAGAVSSAAAVQGAATAAPPENEGI